MKQNLGLFQNKLINNTPFTCHVIGRFFRVSGKKLQRHYKKHLSSYSTWETREYAHQWIIYPENIGTHLAIDEVGLSQGELYTVVTNIKTKSKEASLVAISVGTKTEQVIEQVSKIDSKKR